jgi:signal transduction histidine kinase
MRSFIRIITGTMESGMIAILTISFILLLSVLIVLEIIERSTPIEWAESNATLSRLDRIHSVLENLNTDQRIGVLGSISACHDGYTMTAFKHPLIDRSTRTAALEARIAKHLAIELQDVSVGYASLSRNDFSYRECSKSEIDLPMMAIVISVHLQSGEWFNTEVHPHEWHLQDLVGRILRYIAAFILVGFIAIFLIRRLSRPLKNLTRASQQFADGLNPSPVSESGPPDLKRAIASFNAMQLQVAADVKQRTDTLAAISHDLRTPLTALRIRTEFVEDDETRESLIVSIDKMEKIIASALEFLRGEARSEPMRHIDLSAMLASECSDFEDAGQQAEFIGEKGLHWTCRPEALASAVRNLIENANKYGGGAKVELLISDAGLDISVSDTGPGIPDDKFESALEPFHRLSEARESDQGGFGLGLTIAKAIAEGHDGELILKSNDPSGLIIVIRLPATS